MRPAKIIAGIFILFFLLSMKVQAQSITLTFSGVNNGLPVSLDRIEIQNLDKGCDTTLYYPNVSLLLQPLGIGDQPSDPAGFTVFQNVPNPAIGHTAIRVYQPETGAVSVVVTELAGRQVASFSGELERGYHLFEFTPGNSGGYLFSAGYSGLSRSIMILSGKDRSDERGTLKYTGMTEEKETLKSTHAGGFTFSIGDSLLYTAYYDTIISVIEDAPQGNMSYTFDFVNTGTPCPGIPTITDPRDGQVYPTVQIGTQCWLQKNMNIGTRIDCNMEQTNNGVIEKYCYNDNEANCNTYGGLYQWHELMQYVTSAGVQGLCPPGWHIPTDAEWTTLTSYLGGLSGAGGKLKETGTVHWDPPNTGATNSSGFTALPGGFWQYYSGLFYYLKFTATFWSSTYYSSAFAWYRLLGYDGENVYRDCYFKTYGYSCRCLQD